MNLIASFNESETEDSDSDMEQAEQLLTLYEDYIEKSWDSSEGEDISANLCGSVSESGVLFFLFVCRHTRLVC